MTYLGVTSEQQENENFILYFTRTKCNVIFGHNASLLGLGILLYLPARMEQLLPDPFTESGRLIWL